MRWTVSGGRVTLGGGRTKAFPGPTSELTPDGEMEAAPGRSGGSVSRGRAQGGRWEVGQG